METRVIKTQFWKDDYIETLTPLQKLLFNYLLTNAQVNILHCYELRTREIMLDTGLSEAEIKKSKTKFQQDGKFGFYKNWVFIVNAHKHESFTGVLNEKAKQKRIDRMSADVKAWYESVLDKGIDTAIDTPIDDPIDRDKKQEVRNKKSENNLIWLKEFIERNDSAEALEIFGKHCKSSKKIFTTAEKLVEWCKSKGKTYKDYRAALTTWLIKDSENAPVVEEEFIDFTKI